MKKKVSVVGAGVAGLATAARLAYNGYDVEVFEKLPNCGGRNNIIEERGFKFDTGPSFVLMPDFFREVFSYCRENPDDYLELKALDPGYKIFYPDAEALTVYRDSARTKEELERIERGAGPAFDRYVSEITGIYNALKPLLYKCFTPAALANPGYWPLLTRIRPLESYWGLASRYFNSEKLRYAFTFEAMFMGVSPFQAPAFYSIISYADHVQKIFHPVGGMYQIPMALERLGKKFAVKFNYNAEVSSIERRNGGFILNTELGQVSADKVVVGADYAAAQENLLKRRLPRFKYSCSVFLIYLGLKKKLGRGLAHHNLFFSPDLARNLKEIFEEQVTPEEPSFYVHVPTLTDQSLAPAGKEIVYILIPVANLKNQKEKFSEHQKRLREFVFSKINSALGINLKELIEVEHRFYPEDFIKRYNIKYGATFGLAHNLMQSAFFRPANFDRRLKGLFYAGASTQPGGGLPVVIAGSRIVADLITKS